MGTGMTFLAPSDAPAAEANRDLLTRHPEDIQPTELCREVRR